MSQAAIDKTCEKEGRQAGDIEWPKIELSSKTLCDLFEDAVDVYRPTYFSELKRAAEEKRRKEEAAAAAAVRRREETARRREEAEGRTGETNSGIMDRLRIRTKTSKAREISNLTTGDCAGKSAGGG
jgi:sRNA-binding protein